jgi:hypothetical protein
MIQYHDTFVDSVLVNRVEVVVPDPDPAAVSAVTRWRSMGFSDDEIIAMAPALADAVTYDPN